MNTYAQMHEDMRLWSLVEDKADGHYIDVGANDPLDDSVSKSFYDAGWTGINVEPLPDKAVLLRAEQPHSVTVEAALSDAPGYGTLRTDPSRSGLSTLDERNARRGHLHVHIPVVVTTLAAVCDDFVTWPIDWLKIDVEGYERQVIAGGNWEKYRPEFVVVEATVPRTHIESHESWEPMLLGFGYDLIEFDGLNRWYRRAA